jgi:hypothetical protein
MSGFTGRKPNFIVSVRPKGSDTPGHRCGVAWLNKDGSVSIQLRPCTVLAWNDDCYISLFPNEWKGEPKTKPTESTDSEFPFA